jgi:hypothetical protein
MVFAFSRALTAERRLPSFSYLIAERLSSEFF